MENFTFHNPTKIIFGREALNSIGEEVKLVGKKCLIVIGGGSVKKNGVLAKVQSELNMHNIESVLFAGIKPNPTYEDVDRAVVLAKKEKVDFILAVGGGSVIDSAKGIAMAYYSENSVWDLFSQKEEVKNALPLAVVLTLAATGSEMNPYTVLQNGEEGVKKGFGNKLLYPKVSFLDPEVTFSVPASQTAYGVVDLMSHAMEIYFGKGHSSLSNQYVASILKLAIKYGPKAVKEANNYEARAHIMWLATNALNGTLSTGKKSGDWGVHAVEHSLSVLFDIPHGAGLAIVYPAWLKHHKAEIIQELAFLGREVFDIREEKDELVAGMFIERLEEFFHSLSTTSSLEKSGIVREKKSQILENLDKTRAGGTRFKLNQQDHESILDLMW